MKTQRLYIAVSHVYLEQNIPEYGIMLKGMGMFALRCFRRWKALHKVLPGNSFDK